jgi:hypothetical protein
LKLAIGGVGALPLARCGFRVEDRGVGGGGRAASINAGAEEIPVLVADMANVRSPGRMHSRTSSERLFNLTHQGVRSSAVNVARVLDPDGLFVIECFVPGQGEFTEGLPTPRSASARSRSPSPRTTRPHNGSPGNT